MKTINILFGYNRELMLPHAYEADLPSQHTIYSGYRIAYIIFTWLCTAFILGRYSHLLHGVIPAGSFYREFLVCGGQILFQGVLISFVASEKRLIYLGNMMTVSFAGGLLLGLLLMVQRVSGIENPPFFAAAFMLVAFLMFLEHLRRTKLLGIPWIMSAGWVIYRLIVLLIIL